MQFNTNLRKYWYFQNTFENLPFQARIEELEWLGWCTIGHCRRNWRMKWRNALFASENEINRKVFPGKLDLSEVIFNYEINKMASTKL